MNKTPKKNYLHYHRKKISKFSVIVLLILFSYFIEEVFRNSGYLELTLGISKVKILILFGIGELVFNFGIILMLYGSGVFRLTWKEIRQFDFNKVKFNGRAVYIGFLLNRIAAFVPWCVIFVTGWESLPKIVLLLIFAELLTVILISISIKVKMK